MSADTPLSAERLEEIRTLRAGIAGHGWRWQRCYEIPDCHGFIQKHWALCDDETRENGKVVSGRLVLATDAVYDHDGTPLEENRFLRFIAAAPQIADDCLALAEENARLRAQLAEAEAEAGRVRTVHLQRHERLSDAVGFDPGYSADATIDEAITRLAALDGLRAENERMRDRAIMNAIEATVVACDRDERDRIPGEARVVDYAGILRDAIARAGGA